MYLDFIMFDVNYWRFHSPTLVRGAKNKKKGRQFYFITMKKNDDLRTPRVMGYKQLSDGIGFGKYSDKTLHWVMVNDIGYMQWMVNNQNLKDKLKCLPKVQQDIIQDNLNKERQRKNDRLHVYAETGR